jgi:hypothetical protein
MFKEALAGVLEDTQLRIKPTTVGVNNKEMAILKI